MRLWISTALVVVTFSGAVSAGDNKGGKPPVLQPHDAGAAAHHDAGPPETTDQRAYRTAYVTKTQRHEQEVTKDHGWTPDIGSLESHHWQRAYKALRIRELAEDDKDTAVVARVDQLITKLDQHFFTKLAELAAEAPVIPPAPTLAAPAKGTTLTVGQPVSIKITPVPGATHYYVLLWGQGRQMWSNYDPATKTFGTATDYTIAANDPKWAKFENGKANILVRAITPEKTKAGVAFSLHSHTAQIPVTIAGGAAPAATVRGNQ